SITLYETLRVWWWDILTPLVIHAVAIPFVFGLPLLVGIRGWTLTIFKSDADSRWLRTQIL
ncbi:MAG: hypothetical protein P8186_29020, partial [Anaerolineae bacterium]